MPRNGNTIRGSNRDDVLNGSAADETIHGRRGDDTIDGGLGNDTIFGGDGNDVITAGPGDDEATGGAGSDIFVIGPTTDTLIIKDFEDGQDTIDISAFAVANSAELTMTQVGLNVLIDLGGGDVIRVDNTMVEQLSDADFIF